LEQVRRAAQQLVEDGYLLAEDLEPVVDQGLPSASMSSRDPAQEQHPDDLS
jgi:hypothetical protein